MRRSDREITEFSEIIDVIKKCDVVRLAFNDKDCPYIVPLNFGMTVDGRDVVLYFHSALEGKKLELMREDSRVSFEMDCSHELHFDYSTGHCTMGYESVMGKGRLEFVNDADKAAALKILVDRYKLTVESMTGKRRQVKK